MPLPKTEGLNCIMRPILLFILPVLVFANFSCGPSKVSLSTKAEDATVMKIAVISDLNSSYGSVTYNPYVSQVIKEIGRIKPDIIICAGDLVAGQKRSLTESDINAMWRGFDTVVLQPIFNMQIPFGFTLGNHDASPGFQLDRKLANAFWQQHVSATRLDFVDNSHYPFYFSYTRKNIFFMSWDASASKVPDAVYEWMQAQLQSRAARNARLRILVGHLPLYPIVDSKNKPGEVNAAADSSLAFFQANGIDLYISGHQHAFYPAQKNGFSLLNAGCIGEGERQIMGHTEPARKAFTIIEVPAGKATGFTYTTYDPVKGNLINQASLPDSVRGFNGTVIKESR